MAPTVKQERPCPKCGEPAQYRTGKARVTVSLATGKLVCDRVRFIGETVQECGGGHKWPEKQPNGENHGTNGKATRKGP